MIVVDRSVEPRVAEHAGSRDVPVMGHMDDRGPDQDLSALPRGVLEAKFRSPIRLLLVDVHAEVRARLRDHHGIVVVHAPAGFGKTALMTSWYQDPDEDRRVAWLTLDRADGRVSRLLDHVIEALSRVAPEATHEARRRHVAGDGPMAVLNFLVDGVLQSGDDLVFILDSWDRVPEDSDGHRLLTSLVDAAPATLTVALTTRHQTLRPSLLANVRVLALQMADLRVDDGDAAKLVQALGVPASDAQESFGPAEGWPAGLVLTAQQSFITGRRDRRDDDLQQYVREEVLDRLPERLRALLPLMALPEHVDAATIAIVAPGEDPRLLLGELIDRQLFVIPTEVPGRLRFNGLFRQILLDELYRFPHVEVQQVRLAMADHLVAIGHAEAAGRMLIEAGERSAFRRLVASQWRKVAMRADAASLQTWVDALDPHERHRDPTALLIQAAVARLERDGARISGLLAQLEEWDGPTLASIPGVTLDMDLFRIFPMLNVRGDLDGADALVRGVAPADRHRIHAVVGSFIAWLRGDLRRATSLVLIGLDEFDRHDEPLLLAQALCVHALITLEEGDVDGAGRLAHEACQIVTVRGLQQSPALIMSPLSMALVAVAAGDLDGAERILEHVEAVIAGRDDRPAIFLVSVARLRLHAARGDAVAHAESVTAAREGLAAWASSSGLARLLDVSILTEAAPPVVLATVDDGSALSEAELRVLEEIAIGGSRRDVAARLHVSLDTVKTHLTAIYRHLGVADRSAAVAVARRLGLVGDAA